MLLYYNIYANNEDRFGIIINLVDISHLRT